jgi:hypothetical protein
MALMDLQGVEIRGSRNGGHGGEHSSFSCGCDLSSVSYCC